MNVVLPAVTGVSCLISFLLLLRDFDDQNQMQDMECRDQCEKTNRISISALIYSGVSVLATVLIAVMISRNSGSHPWMDLKRMVLLSVIWPVAYIDYRTLRIPNLFILYGLGCRVIILIFELLLGNQYVWVQLVSEVIAAVALLLASLLCILVVKNGIGFGDIKLFLVMGLMLGMSDIWNVIFTSLLISFLIAVYVLVTKKKNRTDAIPFGPAIVVGTYLSICMSGM